LRRIGRIPKDLVVLLKLLQLRGQRIDLLNLVVDHLHVLGDVLGFINDILRVQCGVVHDPLSVRGCDAQQTTGDDGTYCSHDLFLDS
jgi:hypothetical protein